jgi:hypothetical protein
MNGEVLLFKKEFEKQLVESTINIPVDEAQVITDDVRAVICKFDALSSPLGAPFALQLSLKDLAAEHIQRVEPGHKSRVEQIGQSLS